MKMKKYEATTEQQAIEMVKNELGMDAIILNIKKIQPRGLFSFFRKPKVEVTAAYEENPSVKEATEDGNRKIISSGKAEVSDKESGKAILRNIENAKSDTIEKQRKTIDELERKLYDAEGLLEQVMKKLAVSSRNFEGSRRYDNTMLQFFYERLVSQGVLPEIADVLLKDIENIEDLDNLDINLIVKVVYNRIIKILGEPRVLKVHKTDRNYAKNVVFIGPTGVGKTTTIAKLSSQFIFKDKLNVGFITADTYRIAAVEQLKTYADILNSEVGVVYNSEDVIQKINEFKVVNDVIFIDTAGRSHKSFENLSELKSFLDAIPDADIYLVLSITTKYEDLLSIIESYSKIADFKIIFTKLDETSALGSVLNVCYETGKEISYATDGQNVPDDIDIVKPEKIARDLLGSG